MREAGVPSLSSRESLRMTTARRTAGRAPARILIRVGLVIVSSLMAIAAVEGAYRAWRGLPIFSGANWRTQRIQALQVESPALLDSRLGWTMRPWVGGPGFNTLDLGIRSNGLDEPGVRVGGVLAVGDSFTAGSDVVDSETWPAHLERILGTPVVNAGVGGYGTDQIIMRAEQLLPLVRPHTLVVGFLDDDIARAEYSVYGQPKPYYGLDNGVLTEHRPGDLQGGGLRSAWDRARRSSVRALGHSAAADAVLAKLAPQLWFLSPEGYIHAEVDGPAVTCALLDRLGRQTRSSDVHALVFMQYGGLVYTRTETPPPPADRVLACVKRAGFDVVDQFEPLKAVYRRDRSAFSAYYAPVKNGLYGHMSSLGNLNAAELLATAIRRGGTATASSTASATGNAPLLPRSEVPTYPELLARVASTSHATFEAIAGGDRRPTGVYRLVARGAGGEHYVAASSLGSPPGRHTLTAEVASDSTNRVRLQLLDGRSSVALADVDLNTAETVTQARESLHATVHATRMSDGWIRVTITADLPAPGRTIIVQLLSKDGQTGFEAHGESIRVRVLRLEHGV